MDEMIPRELAEALMHWDLSPDGIVVGELARNFPRNIDIAGLKVVGNMGSDQHSATVLASDTDTERALAARFERALEQAGFKRHMHGGRGGFGSLNGNQQFESAELTISVFTRTRAQGGGCLTVSVHPPAPKDHQQRMAHLRGRMAAAPMPQLTDPPGTRNRGGGGGGSGSFSHINSELSPCISIHDAIAHYDQQLKQLGWVGIGRDVNETTAFISYKLTDDRGDLWCGTLTIAARRDDNVMPVAFALFDLKSRNTAGSTSFATSEVNF